MSDVNGGATPAGTKRDREAAGLSETPPKDEGNLPNIPNLGLGEESMADANGNAAEPVDAGAQAAGAELLVDVSKVNKQEKVRNSARMRVEKELTNADQEAKEKAVWEALKNKNRNGKNWRVSTEQLKKPLIADKNKPGELLTPSQYLEKNIGKKRQTFKNLTFKDKIWETVLEAIQQDTKSQAIKYGETVRESVALVFGTENADSQVQELAKFLWLHAEALREMEEQAQRDLRDGDWMDDDSPKKKDSKKTTTTTSSSSSSSASAAGATGSGNPSSSSTDKPSGPAGLVQGLDFGASVLGGGDPPSDDSQFGDLSPTTQALLNQCSAAMISDTADQLEAAADLTKADLRAPLTTNEVGDWDASRGLLAIIKKRDTVGNTELLRAVFSVAHLGGRVYPFAEEYEKLSAALCKMLTTRAAQGYTMMDFVYRFTDELNLCAPHTIRCANFLDKHIQSKTLRLVGVEYMEVRDMLDQVEIECIFQNYADVIRAKAAEVDARQKIANLLKPIGIAVREKKTLTDEQVKEINAGLAKELDAARSNGNAATFYATLMLSVRDHGVRFHFDCMADTFLNKKSIEGANMMPSLLMPIVAFQNVRFAREDGKRILSNILPVDVTKFRLLTEMRRLASPELQSEIVSLEQATDKLNGEQLSTLKAADDEFRIPAGWVFGGKWDVAARKMQDFFTSTVRQRMQTIRLGQMEGNDDDKVCVDFAHRVAAKYGMKDTNAAAILNKLGQLVDSIAQGGAAEAVVTAAETLQKKLKFGVVFFNEAMDIKHREIVGKFTTAMAASAEKLAMQAAKNRGLVNAVKGTK
ncbi:unnamed protein product [Amoebophrya sp. A25]|nr:unnamed protein product [Amoebophrya sp. A25]|eukprot:GSA25T00023419001.1